MPDRALEHLERLHRHTARATDGGQRLVAVDGVAHRDRAVLGDEHGLVDVEDVVVALGQGVQRRGRGDCQHGEHEHARRDPGGRRQRTRRLLGHRAGDDEREHQHDDGGDGQAPTELVVRFRAGEGRHSGDRETGRQQEGTGQAAHPGRRDGIRFLVRGLGRRVVRAECRGVLRRCHGVGCRRRPRGPHLAHRPHAPGHEQRQDGEHRRQGEQGGGAHVEDDPDVVEDRPGAEGPHEQLAAQVDPAVEHRGVPRGDARGTGPPSWTTPSEHRLRLPSPSRAPAAGPGPPGASEADGPRGQRVSA